MQYKAARTLTALGVALAIAVAGCEAKKSSNPLSPSVAGPIAGVEISPPVLVSPSQGFKFKESEQPIKLVINNATTTGVRPLTYVFEVATDNAFATKVFSRAGVPPGNGQTSVQLDRLEIGRAYFWRARAEDGANTGTFATSSFEIFPKPAVNAPVPVSPVNNEEVSTATPVMRAHNATRTGPVGGLGYEFQIAADQGFAQLRAAAIVPEGAGDTTFTSSPLDSGGTFYWRVRASDGETASLWSATQVFRTAAGGSSPGPTPGPAPGGPCISSSPLKVVECERAKWGFMPPGDIVSFLKSVARSLNASGIPDGPFGILRKGGGNNCLGYSCDIICSGNGSAQKQWDVLSDSGGAQRPSWNGPAMLPNIRLDVCEPQ
jgi:hypothetical protein